MTVPVPGRCAAVKVTVGPVAGVTVPGVPGASVHVAETGNSFPSWSRPIALNAVVAPVVTVTDAGSSRIEIGAAPVTARLRVAAVTPAPDAVIVGIPVVVSW